MSRVLLDTHVFVWALGDPDRLDDRCWEILNNPDHALELSIASAWELAIKSSTGKITLPGDVRAFVADGCRAARVSILSIDLVHLDELERLPMHHRDPFDRMIIAQARSESIEVLTLDRAFQSYEVDLALDD